jgi:hypothetical protein
VNQNVHIKPSVLIGYAVIAAYALASVISFVVADEQRLLSRLSDDAYFYLKMASNHATLGTITFDGRTATNGFHPLWQATLLPLFKVMPDRIAALRAVGILSTLLVSAAALMSWRLMRRAHGWVASAVGLGLLLLYMRVFAGCCMETSLLLPLSVLALTLLNSADPWESPRTGARMLLLIGVILGLVQMARLDAVLFNLSILGTVGAASWRRFGPRTAAARVAVLGFPAALGGAAYVAWNLVTFGRVVPVSGAVKTLGGVTLNTKFAQQLLHLPGAPDAGAVWLVYAALLVAAIVYLARPPREIGGPGPGEPVHSRVAVRPGTLQAVAVFMTVFTLWYLFTSSWHLWGWYSYPAFLVGATVAPTWVDAAARRNSRFAHTLSAMLAAAILVAALGLSMRGGLWACRRAPHGCIHRSYDLALRLNEAAGPGACVGMADFAASFGYFFEGRVLQLEGLVGDYEIVDAIRNNTLADYMTGAGVTHVAAFADVPADYTEWVLLVPSSYHTTGPKAAIRLRREDELIRDNSARPPLVVWRWRDR